MVLEKETWLKLPPDTIQIISFAGLIGDGAPLISLSSSKSMNANAMHSNNKSVNMVNTGTRKSGFSHWIKNGNPFLPKLSTSKEGYVTPPQPNGSSYGELDGGSANNYHGDRVSRSKNDSSQLNGANSVSEDENEDLLADFIDEDSQLPSRSSKPHLSRFHSSQGNDEESTTQTGSSLCLLRWISIRIVLKSIIFYHVIFSLIILRDLMRYCVLKCKVYGQICKAYAETRISKC